MAGGRNWLRKAAMLLVLCAGGVGASTPSSLAASGWTADPDSQFLLDVNIRQLRLGDGVRAYNTPEGTCVVLGDFLATLDVPVKIDLAAKRASGWAFKEKNRISIDYGAMTAAYGAKSEPIGAGTVRETPEGWCVQTSALERWFGIGVKPVTASTAFDDVALAVADALSEYVSRGGATTWHGGTGLRYSEGHACDHHR